MTTVATARPVSATASRWSMIMIWASWPIGFGLIMAHTIGGVLGRPMFLLAIVVYVGVLAAALRACGLGTGPRRDAALLLLAGPMIFVLAGLTRPPTALSPGLMLLNAAVLALGAGVLIVAAAGLVLDRGRLDRAGLLGVLGLLIGTTGWLVNLVSRWAVVLSGASTAQVEVEAEAWMAMVYLRGLPDSPYPMSFLLVWMDLLQIVYVALAYSGFALITVGVVRRGLVGRRPAIAIIAVATTLAGLVLTAASISAWVGAAGQITAWTAFVLTIPFMSTLVPYLLGSAMLGHSSSANTPLGLGRTRRASCRAECSGEHR